MRRTSRNDFQIIYFIVNDDSWSIAIYTLNRELGQIDKSLESRLLFTCFFVQILKCDA